MPSSKLFERLVEAGATGLVLALIIGAFAVAGVIDMTVAIVMLAVAWFLGTAAIIISDVFRERNQRWPVVGMSAASILLAIMLSGIGKYIDLHRPRAIAAADPIQLKAPSGAVTAQIPIHESSVLHRHYEADDRARLSELLFTVYNFLNNTISPLQLEIYRLSNAPSTAETMKRLKEMSDNLESSRHYLDNLVQANGYYRDEIQDVLGVGDPLNADITAVNNYVDAISAVPPDPQDRAARIVEPSVKVLREENVNLGNWVSEANHHINAKRDALE
jgi:hypothetical protein